MFNVLSAKVVTTYFRVHHTIIGLGVFHFCVRNGNRWDNTSIITTTELNLLWLCEAGRRIVPGKDI